MFPATTVQTCIIHLIRASLKYVPRRQFDAVTKDLKLIYTALNPDQAMVRYNLPGRGPTLSLQFMTDSDERLPTELEDLALACGMVPSRNRVGDDGFRRFVAIAQGLNAEAATALGVQLARELVDGLTP